MNALHCCELLFLGGVFLSSCKVTDEPTANAKDLNMETNPNKSNLLIYIDGVRRSQSLRWCVRMAPGGC